MLHFTFLQEYNAQTFQSGPNQKQSTCERVLLWKTDGFVSCVTISQSLKFENSEKFSHYWYISLLNLNLHSNYGFEFINQNANWKPYCFKGGFDLETIDIDPCIKIMLVQSFGKVVIKMIDRGSRNGVFP